ncbi:SURF1 family protein [Acetobacteraceae bacterium H6797]|nr:SURF1 family protein [Acetobacteraceae bacterium H6797]
MTMPSRRLLWPGIATLAMLAVLIGLGTWQLHRLAWKTALLARFEASEQAPPVPLPEHPEPWEKVSVTGRYRPSLSALVNLEVRNNVLGSRLIVPLERRGAPMVLVDRGWVPLAGGPPVEWPRGEVTVTGYINPGEQPSMFAAHDDVAARKFYTLNPNAIARGLKLNNVEPYVFVLLDPDHQGIPEPAKHLPRPRNNHLGYVVTWYGLAVALLGVFLAWAWQTRRRA